MASAESSDFTSSSASMSEPSSGSLTPSPLAALLKPDELFSVKGIVALITGGGTGIGLMLARALAHAGAARVYIVGRHLSVLQDAAESINRPSIVVPLYCDVTSKLSLAAAAAQIQMDVGYLNLLICNAGVAGPQVRVPPEAGEEGLERWAAAQMAVPGGEWMGALEVNAVGVWYTVMACLGVLGKGMREEGMRWSGGKVGSQVVVVSSIAGFNKSAPGGWAYGVSKAASTQVARMLSCVLPTWGIRANCLCPGLFPSQMSAPIVAAAGGSMEGGDVINVDEKIVPLGRMGTENDIAGQILYLASRAGAYLNGATIVVDGGRLGTFPSSY